MSIRLPNSCFVHVPRTGGLWLGSVLTAIGIKHQVFRGDVDSHFTWAQLPLNWRMLPSFSFVRQPLPWLRSRWSHCIENNLAADYRHYGVHREFDELVADTFEQTTRNILARRPGIVGRTYREMLTGVHILKRTESLPGVAHILLDDLEGIGKITGSRYTILNTDAVNSTSAAYSDRTVLPPSLEQELTHSEQDAQRIWDTLSLETLRGSLA